MKKYYILLLAVTIIPTLIFAQPVNSTCGGAVIHALPTNGTTVTVSGSTANAIDSDSFGNTHVWEAFSITECSEVSINMSGSSVDGLDYFITIFNSCPLNVTSTGYFYDAAYDINTSGSVASISLNFPGLPAGTYYYPVTVANPSDNYMVNFSAIPCPDEPDTCLTYTNGPYASFNDVGGAPTPNSNGFCTPVVLEFEAFSSESYTIDGFVNGTVYTFSICTGGSAGAWNPAISVIDPNGDVVAYVEDCTVTWTAQMSGTFVIGISEVDNCFNPQNQNVSNGFPSLTCEGSSSISEVEKTKFSIYPNPNNGQFTVLNSGKSGNYHITVIDMTGRIVHSQKVALNANSVADVKFNNVETGIYMLELKNSKDNSSMSQFIVVQ